MISKDKTNTNKIESGEHRERVDEPLDRARAGEPDGKPRSGSGEAEEKSRVLAGERGVGGYGLDGKRWWRPSSTASGTPTERNSSASAAAAAATLLHRLFAGAPRRHPGPSSPLPPARTHRGEQSLAPTPQSKSSRTSAPGYRLIRRWWPSLLEEADAAAGGGGAHLVVRLGVRAGRMAPPRWIFLFFFPFSFLLLLSGGVG